MRRHRSALLAGAAATVLLAGYGGTSRTAGTSTQAAAADRGMVEFARCMRTHGVNMPDPFHRPGHAGLSIELPQQGPATTQAYAACGQFLQPTIELKERATQHRITPAVRLGLIRYAQCMRSHAVPMLDPTPSGNSPSATCPESAATSVVIRHSSAPPTTRVVTSSRPRSRTTEPDPRARVLPIAAEATNVPAGTFRLREIT